MAKKCGLVVYYRPCRKRKRHYTKCDAARIARYASESDRTEDVLVSVGVKLGYEVLIDAEELVDSAKLEAEMLKELKPYFEFYDGVKLGRAISQGAIGIFRFTVGKVGVYILKKQTTNVAKVLAIPMAKLLAKKVIIGTPCLK